MTNFWDTARALAGRPDPERLRQENWGRALRRLRDARRAADEMADHCAEFPGDVFAHEELHRAALRVSFAVTVAEEHRPPGQVIP